MHSAEEVKIYVSHLCSEFCVTYIKKGGEQQKKMTKLFVGNLAYTTTDQELNSLFSQFGTVSSATLVTDKYSGQSRGFGFVEMENDEEAQTAIKELNGSQQGGRSIVVSVARPKEDRPRDNFGGGGYRGGGQGQRRDFRERSGGGGYRGGRR